LYSGVLLAVVVVFYQVLVVKKVSLEVYLNESAW